MEPKRTGAHTSPDVQTAKPTDSEWLTVSEAIVRCTERGLLRTPKTIRKWAARSYADPESPDISVRREDTGNGFRWSIEAESLHRKINEELEFDRRQKPDPVETGSPSSKQVSMSSLALGNGEPSTHASEPVRTSEDRSGVSETKIEIELREQLKQRTAEIEFLRGELTHRRQTDKALATVIEAFKLNAEASRTQLADGGGRFQPSADQVPHSTEILPRREEGDHR